MGSDDSTGKNKITQGKARNAVLLTTFVVGICIGIVIAEQLYVRKGGKLPQPRVLAAQAVAEQSGGVAVKPGSGSTCPSGSEYVLAPGDIPFEPYSDSQAPRNDLEKVLREIAPTKEVFAAVANKNVMWDGMLQTFASGIKTAGIKNHLILALDEETRDWATKEGYNAFLLKLTIPKSQQGTGDNHAVSAMKFGILRRFLELGWSVLLSDVDIAVLQNPFDHMYRDHDVEGMTDGFTEPTAYGAIDGFDDPSMGWARYAQFYKHFNLNSGLFYLKANVRTLNLMRRLEQRLAREKYWDQTAYNEEIFFLSHGTYRSPQVSVRVMDIDKFMNSKRLFKDIRKRPEGQWPGKPVTVHINYHPDKHERMKAVFKYWVDGDKAALDKFPGGSEAGSR